MKKLNSRGFSAVEVLILIVIVGLVSSAAWYVGRKSGSDNKKTPLSQTATTSTQTTSQTPSTTTTDTTKYVSIKEWGVKIPESYIPAGFVYEVGASQDPNGTITFNSTDLKAAGCTQKNYGFIVARGKAGDTYIGDGGDKSNFKEIYDQYHANASTFHMIFNNYYFFDDAGTVCSGGQAEITAQNTIGDALKHMVSI